MISPCSSPTSSLVISVGWLSLNSRYPTVKIHGPVVCVDRTLLNPFHLSFLSSTLSSSSFSPHFLLLTSLSSPPPPPRHRSSYHPTHSSPPSYILHFTPWRLSFISPVWWMHDKELRESESVSCNDDILYKEEELKVEKVRKAVGRGVFSDLHTHILLYACVHVQAHTRSHKIPAWSCGKDINRQLKAGVTASPSFRLWVINKHKHTHTYTQTHTDEYKPWDEKKLWRDRVLKLVQSHLHVFGLNKNKYSENLCISLTVTTYTSKVGFKNILLLNQDNNTIIHLEIKG